MLLQFTCGHEFKGHTYRKVYYKLMLSWKNTGNPSGGNTDKPWKVCQFLWESFFYWSLKRKLSFSKGLNVIKSLRDCVMVWWGEVVFARLKKPFKTKSCQPYWICKRNFDGTLKKAMRPNCELSFQNLENQNIKKNLNQCVWSFG